MTVPLIARIGALVIATTAFYTYVGQMVPQKEVQPPQETAIGSDMTTADMVKVGRGIMEGKGICLTCHTIGKSGALRFPDLAGIGASAKSRVPGLNDIDYLAQSMYEPTAFVVPGFPPAMPPVNQPPIGLTDQEILCVIAALQSLGSTPTVTLKTTHKWYGGGAAPAGAPAQSAPGAAQPLVPPAKGAQLRPAALQPVSVHLTASRSKGSGIVVIAYSERSAPQARPAGVERGDGAPANDGDGSGGAKPPGGKRGAPQARPAGVERGDGAPANDGDGGSGGAKPPGGKR